jgi:hypothetical protein
MKLYLILESARFRLESAAATAPPPGLQGYPISARV